MSDVMELIQHWAAAEQANDAKHLDTLLASDFHGVGPFGFVLDRDQWLVRFDNGLVNSVVTIENPQPREYGDAAVVIGVMHQQTTWAGNDNSGRFRVTLVAVREGDRWQLANVHIGPLQAPPR
ncbi:nuclear transport factor 2 family protein [Nonomuraea sp. NPDC050556]|uniref:nuclear transport factor 2 family protein n=1 Tax=Nonomuraea sp. NPDC050556 TaxID=3364369 RepID=UPI0037A4DA94